MSGPNSERHFRISDSVLVEDDYSRTGVIPEARGCQRDHVGRRIDAIGFPMGLRGHDDRSPDECPVHRRRVEKARRDIRQHRQHCRLSDIAALELFSSDDVHSIIAIAKGEKTVEQCTF